MRSLLVALATMAMVVFVLGYLWWAKRQPPEGPLYDICLYDDAGDVVLCRCNVGVFFGGGEVRIRHTNGHREVFSGYVPALNTPSPDCVSWGP